MIINKTWPQINHLGAQWTGLSEGKYSRGWKLREIQWRLIWKQCFSRNSHPDRRSSAEQEQEQNWAKEDQRGTGTDTAA